MTHVNEVLGASPVMPVLAFKSVNEAVEVSSLLFDCGVRVFEITLRHETALDAIKQVKAALPSDAIVGAGTILSPDLAKSARNAGAAFGVSPGLTKELGTAVRAMGWAFLPGVSTISEAMAARDMGFEALKFFPASVSGGPGFLKAAGAVLPDIQFCPTGGITTETARDYLSLANVPTVGGSWITPRNAEGEIDLDKTKANAMAIKQ
ncbi:MAG: bifunctional 4-hydroxy-2-oxoglutarate aldolase/2-dehydro-3-deoxy-phosphogluconate aldolase [Kordiimonadaceae bacterium]|nr:bifunctional 4-hydroxy-2-oxoglutarate aldolase/2-dehydro-3-deoxy-phosphogluconate aldolase [Kordiimonadaceae bacterium]MBO6567786.1 bifunctional 4-hydroxy-2-oxoglutarate aldolase/2-dehydro-3-deoxy-phosphogluconate aldolase [Kordiimonadaceae bacterium]MBO6962999.1 bifunctional 4-hydroxy-2-oxoglutarate aldolase/2-dehydro-3-deoxy-phosphogluconate aldolase [Kordiimonadaceae bacterium]